MATNLPAPNTLTGLGGIPENNNFKKGLKMATKKEFEDEYRRLKHEDEELYAGYTLRYPWPESIEGVFTKKTLLQLVKDDVSVDCLSRWISKKNTPRLCYKNKLWHYEGKKWRTMTDIFCEMAFNDGDPFQTEEGEDYRPTPVP